MGCTSSKNSVKSPESDLGLNLGSIGAAVHQVPTRDPRWDHEGFNAWADAAQIQFLRVDYLRQLRKEGRTLPAGQCVPRYGMHVGAPPNGVEIFNIIHTYLGQEHPDPTGEHLADLVELLSYAEPWDLVLLDFCAAPKYGYTASMDGTFVAYVEGDARFRYDKKRGEYTDLTERQAERKEMLLSSSYQVTYSPIRTVVLHRIPDDITYDANQIWRSAWMWQELTLSAYCQQILNANDDDVRKHIRPDMLMNPVKSLRDGVKSGLLQLTRNADLEAFIVPGIRRALASMEPVITDVAGFANFCTSSQVAWVTVAYIRSFVRSDNASPFPRRQELPRGCFYIGLPPENARRFVVSHPWACEHHPTPSGERIRSLKNALDVANAVDTDAVFFDYASLFQRSRPQQEGLPPQRPITANEQKLFRIALFEMSRMYAFSGCEVLVLPQLELLQSSASSQPVKAKYSNVKKRDCLHSDTWGWINEVPYENRGWCAAEFSCALQAGIVANLTDPAVQAVLRARDWPTSVKQYQKMMEDTRIEFTATGDRSYVAYLFFKMSFDLRNVVEQEV